MRRLSVRSSDSLAGDLVATVTALGVGFAAGFLTAGLVGPVRRGPLGGLVGRFRRPDVRPVSGGATAERITTSLAADADLAPLGLSALPAGRGRVELHGWVPSRSAGVRAMRLAASAAPTVEVTSRLRVRGEDDRHAPTHGAPRSA